MARQRLQLKVQKLVYVQRAGFVLLVKLHIARLVYLSVEHALLDQELRPLEVAVPGNKVLSRSNRASFMMRPAIIHAPAEQ